MPRVKLLVDHAGPDARASAGDVVYLNRLRADELVAAGRAELVRPARVEPAAPAETPSPARPSRGRKPTAPAEPTE